MGKILIIKGTGFSGGGSGSGGSGGSGSTTATTLTPKFTYYFCQSNATNYLTSEEFTWTASACNRVKAVFDLTGRFYDSIKIDLSEFTGHSFTLRFLSDVLPETTGVQNPALQTNKISDYNNDQWTTCTEDTTFELPEGTNCILLCIAPNDGTMANYFTQETAAATIEKFSTTVHPA